MVKIFHTTWVDVILKITIPTFAVDVVSLEDLLRGDFRFDDEVGLLRDDFFLGVHVDHVGAGVKA